MIRPKLYKENGVWICERKTIKATGATPVEAFLNFFLKKASSHLHEGEVEL